MSGLPPARATSCSARSKDRQPWLLGAKHSGRLPNCPLMFTLLSQGPCQARPCSTSTASCPPRPRSRQTAGSGEGAS